jgi:thioredoxin-related protein
MKHINVLLLVMIGFIGPFNGWTQDSNAPRTYSFEQLETAFEQEEKPAIIFLHTQWCKFCKAMSEDTFNDKGLVELINRDFYFVPFDAESKEDIVFRNVKFSYKPTGHNTGIHQLAQELLSKSRDTSYPILVIINKNLEILYQYSGFLDEEEVTDILAQLI